MSMSLGWRVWGVAVPPGSCLGYNKRVLAQF